MWLASGSEDDRYYSSDRKWSVAFSDAYPLIILHWQTVNTRDVSIRLDDGDLLGLAILPTAALTWRYWRRGILRPKHLTLRRTLNYLPPVAYAFFARFTPSDWQVDNRLPYCWLIAGLLIRAALLAVSPPVIESPKPAVAT
jgi:hypothetical protein